MQFTYGWAINVRSNKIGTLGVDELSKVIFNNIETPERFVLVKKTFEKKPDIEKMLGDMGVEWP